MVSFYSHRDFFSVEFEFVTRQPSLQRVGKVRQVPVNKELRVFIEQYLKLHGKVKPADYVFIYQGGTSKIKPVRGDRVYR